MVFSRAAAIALPILVLLPACRTSSESAVAPLSIPSPFVEIAREAGLVFEHDSGMAGQWWMPEIMGAGGALFDYDNDGDLDIYCVQGMTIGKKPGGATGDRLYRNGLAGGKLRFTDVTATALAGSPPHAGMGAAAADFDGDGFVDLYVTEFAGPNRLLHNNGNGTFTDIAAPARVADSRWSTSASWADFDGDGHLDLFVANYVRYNAATHRICRDPAGQPLHCPPSNFDAETSRLFRNNGRGGFDDVSQTSGIAAKPGPALGVIAADVDADGKLDFYVANDAKPNHFWRNRGNGTFDEAGLQSASAVNADGKAEASMGVLADDIDRDGDLDLLTTNLTGEKATLHLNLGAGAFEDSSARLGLDAATRQFTGFGTALLDADNDGWLDFFIANGAIAPIEQQRRAGDAYPFRQRTLLFRNAGGANFEPWAGMDARELIGRGVASGDLDNDGLADLVVFSCQGPVSLFRNTGASKSWLGLRLITADGRRDALGAVAELERSGQPALRRRVHTDGSYLSSGDPRVLFGLGSATAADAAVTVTWPDGSRERWNNVAPGKYTTLRQGTGSK